jgi:primosomal protein N' (replication factor Y)
VRVAVDVPALADQRRELDYAAPAGIEVGSVVRVPLHGRRAGGWVVDVGVSPPEGVRLSRVAKVSGYGPPPDVVELTAWGAWRWAGRRTALLRAGSPVGAVRALPPASGWAAGRPAASDAVALADDARAAGRAVVRLPPAADPLPLVRALLRAGPALVVAASVEGARAVAQGLRAQGWPVAVVPDGWARARAGGVTVVGARAAAWAPLPGMETVVVLDAHDSGLVETRAPAWSAWVVAAERARRAGVPCVLVTPCPVLEQLGWGRLVVLSRDDERRGWARLEVLDRRRDDPRGGLLGERLVTVLRSATLDRRVLCLLNRKGRVRALACRVCGRATVCEWCGGGMASAPSPSVAPGPEVAPSPSGAGAGPAPEVAAAAARAPAGGAPPTAEGLACQRCHRWRAAVCQACGSTSLRATRIGVSKLRDDLEALARLPVGEVTAASATLPPTPVLVGTEALLHRVPTAAAVVMLDFDAELLAPHLRAAEDALALLARAARVAGGREGPGRVIVQTRLPDHPVVQAAVRADPGLLAGPELLVRTELQLPPVTALALLSGEADLVAGMGAALGERPGIDVAELEDGRVLVRAGDHRALCDALASVGRPAGVAGDRLRVEVDPQRV